MDITIGWCTGALLMPMARRTVMDEFMADIDALVFGRKTFETVLSFSGWPYTKPVIVLTSDPAALSAPAGADCTMMSGEPAEVVAKLAKRGLNRLYIDGGVTIQRFLAARLIQRLIITRIPVLIGSGIPLFGAVRHDIRLTHVSTRTYSSRLVQSDYVIAS